MTGNMQFTRLFERYLQDSRICYSANGPSATSDTAPFADVDTTPRQLYHYDPYIYQSLKGHATFPHPNYPAAEVSNSYIYPLNSTFNSTLPSLKSVNRNAVNSSTHTHIRVEVDEAEASASSQETSANSSSHHSRIERNARARAGRRSHNSYGLADPPSTATTNADYRFVCTEWYIYIFADSPISIP